MELPKIIYLVASAVEMTGVAMIADAYLVKKNGRNKSGIYMLILGMYLELLSMYLKNLI